MAPTFGKAARSGLSVEDDLALGRRYQKAKFDAGFAGINWPKDVGGQGLGHLEKIAFEGEEMKHGFPNVYFGISLGMPVPVLMQFGSDRAFVKERVLKALQGEERSEEHTSELQSLMRNSYAVFCLNKKKIIK